MYYYISMESLYNTLSEGLLDDFETAESKLTASLAEDWFKKYAKVDGKVLFMKNGDIKIHGDVVIRGFDGPQLPAMNIREFIGSLVIERCPNLTTIGSWFGFCIAVDGDISICECPKLETLEGLPKMCDGIFNITGNKSLKTLDGMPTFVSKNIYIMKNGKKFTEGDVLTHLDSGLLPGKKIFV